MSRIFRKSGSSAPASTAATQDWANRQPHLYEHIPPLPTAANVLPDHRNHDGETTSSKSKPVGLSRRLTKKGSIPGDWKQLQQLHLLETEREAWKLNNEREAILLAGLDMEQGQATARSESRYRTTRKYSVTLQESDFVACTQNVSGNSPSIHDTRSDKGRGAIPDPAVPPSHHHNSNLTERTSMYTLSENAVSTLRYTSMFTIQPGDEELDSAGLRQAIATLREEKKRLLVQFDDLEGALHEKYGDPALAATRAHTQRRRDSVSAVSTTGRRMSLSSSVVSSQGGYSVLSTAKGSGSLVPTSPMSRRPSKASSIASSSMRRGLNSSGSTHPGSMETYPTSRPPSTVEEELLFTAISGEGGDDTTRTPHASDLQFQKEYYDLQERKRNIQEKYSARLEYLEARLQGQLNKEKLRR